jgi:hypothetical protein
MARSRWAGWGAKDDRSVDSEEFKYRLGQTVIERVGSGPNASEWTTTIVAVNDHIAVTKTGRSYDRVTGMPMGSPSDRMEYRSIRDASYQKPVEST